MSLWARSAAFAENVVIMDEPTAALGVKESGMVLDLIRKVRDRGLPVILISHNMPHVWELADRIHIQRLGKRATVITPDEYSMSDGVGDNDGCVANLVVYMKTGLYDNLIRIIGSSRSP